MLFISELSFDALRLLYCLVYVIPTSFARMLLPLVVQPLYTFYLIKFK